MYTQKNHTCSSLILTSPSEYKTQSSTTKRTSSLKKTEDLPLLEKSTNIGNFIYPEEIKDNIDNIDKLKKEIERFANRKAFLFKNKLNTITSNLITIFYQYNDKYKNSKPSEERTKKLNEIISAKNALIEAIDEKIKTQKAFNHHINDLNQAKQNLEEAIPYTIYDSQNILYSSLNSFNKEYIDEIIEPHIITQDIKDIYTKINDNLEILSNIETNQNEKNAIKEIKNLLDSGINKNTNEEKKLFLEELKKCLKLTNNICKIAYLVAEINQIDSIISQAYITLTFDTDQIEDKLKSIKNSINTEIKKLGEDDDMLELFNDLKDETNDITEVFKNSKNKFMKLPTVTQDIHNTSIRIDKNIIIILDLFEEKNKPSIITEIENFSDTDISDYTDEEKLLFLEKLKKYLKLTNDIYQSAYLEKKVNSFINEIYNESNFNTIKIKKNFQKIKNIIDYKIKEGDEDSVILFEQLSNNIYNSIKNLYNPNNLDEHQKKKQKEKQWKNHFELVEIQIKIYKIFKKYVTIKDIANLQSFLKKINTNEKNNIYFKENKKILQKKLKKQLSNNKKTK